MLTVTFICHVYFREGYLPYQQNQPPQQRLGIDQIELKGHWLIEVGFEIDTPIKIRIMQGCLVITVETQTQRATDHSRSFGGIFKAKKEITH